MSQPIHYCRIFVVLQGYPGRPNLAMWDLQVRPMQSGEHLSVWAEDRRVEPPSAKQVEEKRVVESQAAESQVAERQLEKS
ncbi:MAG TPA: hypothetical protein VMD99_07350 [Terriglobales bacterium]|nr:hypothetical protein [Terriglobales bacterium]